MELDQISELEEEANEETDAASTVHGSDDENGEKKRRKLEQKKRRPPSPRSPRSGTTKRSGSPRLDVSRIGGLNRWKVPLKLCTASSLKILTRLQENT